MLFAIGTGEWGQCKVIYVMTRLFESSITICTRGLQALNATIKQYEMSAAAGSILVLET